MTEYSRRITITGKRWNEIGGQKTQEVHYQYEEKVTALLDQIQSTRTGHALLMDIDAYASKGKVKIWPPLSQHKRACYATVPLYMKAGKILREADVEFVPSSFGNACSGVGTSPEEALFHELLHAAQTLHGVLDRTPIAKAPKMTDYAEFCAVTASNIFRSDLGRRDLRAGHEGRDAAVTLTDPADYYQFFRDEIDRWFRIQPVFCGHLAMMDIPFNPLRAKTRSARPA